MLGLGIWLKVLTQYAGSPGSHPQHGTKAGVVVRAPKHSGGEEGRKLKSS